MNGCIPVVGDTGSHMARMLAQSGQEVIALNNLSTDFRGGVRCGRLIEDHPVDQNLFDRIFVENTIGTIQNVANTQNLLDPMLRHQIKRFILSSTAAIFCELETLLIVKQHSHQPLRSQQTQGGRAAGGL